MTADDDADATAAVVADPAATARHLRWWYSRALPDAWIVASRKVGNRWQSRSWPAGRVVNDPADAAAVITAEPNWYMRATTVRSAPAAGARGTADATAMVLGFVADLDVAGPDHARDDADGLPLPPTPANALAIAEAVLPPSVVTWTGGGYQAWWRLDRPIWLRVPADRQHAAALLCLHGHALMWSGRVLGWHVDDVSDLARVMRPAGTVRAKRHGTSVVERVGGTGADVTLDDVVDACAAFITAHADDLDDPDDDDRVDPVVGPIRLAVSDDGPTPWAVARALPIELLLADDPAGRWERIDNDGGRWELWRRPGSTSDYSIKVTVSGPDAGGIIVWSSVVAARCGISPGAAVDPFLLWCRLRGADPRHHARLLRRMARGVEPFGGSRADRAIVDALATYNRRGRNDA